MISEITKENYFSITLHLVSRLELILSRDCLEMEVKLREKEEKKNIMI